MVQFIAFLMLIITIFLMSGMPMAGRNQNLVEASNCKSQIAFGVAQLYPQGDSIYVVNADGTGLTQLVQSPIFENWGDLAWSPDGRHLGFIGWGSQDDVKIPYVINTNGSALRQLVDSLEFGYKDFDWSPSGDWVLSIAYKEGDSYTDQIHLIGLKDHQLIKIKSPNDNRVWGAAWSHVGERIVLSSGPANEKTADIYLVTVEELLKGTPVSFDNLTNTDDLNFAAAWSPADDQIAFNSDREGNSDIFVMNADGGNLVRLTSDSESDVVPKWSPDNRRIAYQNSGDLHVVNRDGTDSRMIYSDIGDYEWSPDGTKMVVSTRKYPEDSFDTLLKIINVDTGDVTDLGLDTIKYLQLRDCKIFCVNGVPV